MYSTTTSIETTLQGVLLVSVILQYCSNMLYIYLLSIHCKSKHKGQGVRFYYLVKEGLLQHPNIHLVDNPDAAEIVVYLPVSANWATTECNNHLYRNKTLILDEGL